MDILSYLQFAKKHRLSTKEYWKNPTQLEDWRDLFAEAIWRNNSNLLSDLHSLCPQEFKDNINDLIKNHVISSFQPILKETSKTIIDWTFKNIEINILTDLYPITIASYKRKDLIQYLIENNQFNQYDRVLYQTALSLSHNGNYLLFKYIDEHLNLTSLHERFYNRNLDFLTCDNLYFTLFNKNKNEETLNLLFKNYLFDKNNINKLFQLFLKNHETIQELEFSNFLLEKSISFLKENNNELFNYLKNSNPCFFNCFLYTILPKTYLTLAKFEIADYKLLEKTISDIEKCSSPILHIIELYDNVSSEKITEIFTPIKQFNFLCYFLYENNQEIVSFLIKKNPKLINQQNKEHISNFLVGYFKKESGLEWAKKYRVSGISCGF